MNSDQVQQWLALYVDAWRANEPELIADLFTPDATYYADPFDEGLHGRQAIVDEWLGVEMPRRFETAYRPVLVDGNRAFATGYTRYFNEDGSSHGEWGNAFLLTFDANGKCHEYREWFMKRRL
ncbi:MAG: nuclear transport factor 2 family protein [Candidatus Dormibacteraeota bacterium]|uniref:YybH family protein n=1 Tax=Candidatus Dormibacter sp. TaxID=2973982 RepID=UPI000DB84067|nr:nuclear transport factor 2 family protein [Candidatus Dormibacteraeota bacterium]PZR67544.1 MAG: hypothetical protein DLM66_10810 [Candidatus Dormibacteraeota bacterium]